MADDPKGMDELERTLQQVRAGELSIAEAARRLRPAGDLGFANRNNFV